MAYKIVIIVSTLSIILFSLILTISMYDFNKHSQRSDSTTKHNSSNGFKKQNYTMDKSLQKYNVISQYNTKFTNRYKLLTMLIFNIKKVNESNHLEIRNHSKHFSYKIKLDLNKVNAQQVWEPTNYDTERSIRTAQKIISQYGKFKMNVKMSNGKEIEAFTKLFIPSTTETIDDMKVNESVIIGLKKYNENRNIEENKSKTCTSCENEDPRSKRSTEKQSKNSDDKAKQQVTKLLEHIKSEEDISSVNLETTSQSYDRTTEKVVDKIGSTFKYNLEIAKKIRNVERGKIPKKITDRLRNEIESVIVEGVARNIPFVQVAQKLNKLENSIETIFEEMHIMLRKFESFFDKMLTHLNPSKDTHTDGKTPDTFKIQETANGDEEKTFETTRKSANNVNVYHGSVPGILEKLTLSQSHTNKLDVHDAESYIKGSGKPLNSTDLTYLTEENIGAFGAVKKYTKQLAEKRKSMEKISSKIEVPRRRYFIPLPQEEMYDVNTLVSPELKNFNEFEKKLDSDKHGDGLNINNLLHTLLENMEKKRSSKENFKNENEVSMKKSGPDIEFKGKIMYRPPISISQEVDDGENKNIKKLIKNVYQDIFNEYSGGGTMKLVPDERDKNAIDGFIKHFMESLSKIYEKKESKESYHKPQKTYVLELLGNFRETKNTSPFSSQQEMNTHKTMNENKLDNTHSNTDLLHLLKTYLDENISQRKSEEYSSTNKMRFRRSVNNDAHNIFSSKKYNDKNELKNNRPLEIKKAVDNSDISQLRNKTIIDRIFEYIINYFGKDCKRIKRFRNDLNHILNENELHSSGRNRGMSKENINNRKPLSKIIDFIHNVHNGVLKNIGRENTSLTIQEKNRKNTLDGNTGKYFNSKLASITKNHKDDVIVGNDFTEMRKQRPTLTDRNDKKARMHGSNQIQLNEKFKNVMEPKKKFQFASAKKRRPIKHKNRRHERTISHERKRRDVEIYSGISLGDATRDLTDIFINNPTREDMDFTLDSKNINMDSLNMEQEIGAFLNVSSAPDLSKSTQMYTHYKNSNVKDEISNERQYIDMNNTLERPSATLLDSDGQKQLQNKHVEDYEKIREDIFGAFIGSEKSEFRQKNPMRNHEENSELRSIDKRSDNIKSNKQPNHQEFVDHEFMSSGELIKPVDIFNVHDILDNPRRTIRSMNNMELNSSEGLRDTGSTVSHRDSQISENENSSNQEIEKDNKYNVSVKNSSPISDAPKKNFLRHDRKKKIIKLTRDQLNELIVNVHLNLKSLEKEKNPNKPTLYSNEIRTKKAHSFVESDSQFNSTSIMKKIETNINNLSEIMKNFEKIMNKYISVIPTTTEEIVLMDEISICEKMLNFMDKNTSKYSWESIKSISEKNKMSHSFAFFQDKIYHICDDILNREMVVPNKTQSNLNSSKYGEEPLLKYIRHKSTANYQQNSENPQIEISGYDNKVLEPMILYEVHSSDNDEQKVYKHQDEYIDNSISSPVVLSPLGIVVYGDSAEVVSSGFKNSSST